MGFYKNINADIKEYDLDEELKLGDVRKITYVEHTTENHQYVRTEREYIYNYPVNSNSYYGTGSYIGYNIESDILNVPKLREYEVDIWKYNDIYTTYEIIFEVCSIDDFTKWKTTKARSRHACVDCALRSMCRGGHKYEIPSCKVYDSYLHSDEHRYYFKQLSKTTTNIESRECETRYRMHPIGDSYENYV